MLTSEERRASPCNGSLRKYMKIFLYPYSKVITDLLILSNEYCASTHSIIYTKQKPTNHTKNGEKIHQRIFLAIIMNCFVYGHEPHLVKEMPL